MAINGVKMITDRSLSDVEIAKALVSKGINNMTSAELSDFLASLKGAYNNTDFNRVETAVKYLSQRLYDVPDEIRQRAEDLGVAWEEVFDVSYDRDDYADLVTKGNWSTDDRITADEENRYFQNIVTVVQSVGIYPNFPRKLKGMTFRGANMIEQCLENCNTALINLQNQKQGYIENVSKSWFFSGDLYGGEI